MIKINFVTFFYFKQIIFTFNLTKILRKFKGMFGFELKENELFPGEKIILSKNANSVIKVKDYGLKEIPMLLRNTMGFDSKEAIGGKLYLTNYRFVFKSHALNRLRGKFSIFLNTVKAMKDASVLIVKKMEMDTEGQSYEFVVWGIREIIQCAEQAKRQITKEHFAEIMEHIKENREKLGEGYDYCKLADFLVSNNVEVIKNAMEAVKNPFSVSTVINLADLIKHYDR